MVGRLFLSPGYQGLQACNVFSQQPSFGSSASREAFENGGQDACWSWEAGKINKSRGESKKAGMAKEVAPPSLSPLCIFCSDFALGHTWR